MNDGLFVRLGARPQPLRARPVATRRITAMRPNLRVNVTVKIDVAAIILRVGALLIALLT